MDRGCSVGLRRIRASSRGIVRKALPMALLAACAMPAASRASDALSPDEAYLDGLKGSWVMVGNVGDKPVRYNAEGERVLRGGFLQLHMKDASRLSTYEAAVFIGYDARAHDYIVHWLDQFGAAGARVVATGARDGERLVVTFPYAEGLFRDTFTRDPAKGTWTLLLESQRADGAWTTFARYDMTRPTDTMRKR